MINALIIPKEHEVAPQVEPEKKEAPEKTKKNPSPMPNPFIIPKPIIEPGTQPMPKA